MHPRRRAASDTPIMYQKKVDLIIQVKDVYQRSYSYNNINNIARVCYTWYWLQWLRSGTKSDHDIRTNNLKNIYEVYRKRHEYDASSSSAAAWMDHSSVCGDADGDHAWPRKPSRSSGAREWLVVNAVRLRRTVPQNSRW